MLLLIRYTLLREPPLQLVHRSQHSQSPHLHLWYRPARSFPIVISIICKIPFSWDPNKKAHKFLAENASRGQPSSSSPLPIPRTGSVPRHISSRTSPSPAHSGASSGMNPREQRVGTPSSKPLLGKSLNSSTKALKSGSSRKQQRQVA